MSQSSIPAAPYAVVIEDDALLGGLLGDHLAGRLGWPCQRFDNADDALVYLLQAGEQPSLVVTDHLMPGQLKGSELIGLLNERWPALAMVITSGYGYEITHELPPQVVFLQKPWTLDAVDSAIRLAMARAATL